ncbi:hypothetical protein [Endozoicomonas sp.]|uniref:hypothetical protein n=1 Tax=Endozoicomonas sp. TaxID=1892382 RepID=UPI00383B1805
MNRNVNSFDIDGVIYLGEHRGVYPGPGDIIITGRSIEEAFDTLAMLNSRNITNPVFFNPLGFADKTRESSGTHKASVLAMLLTSGFNVGIHFEDDPLQKQIIEQAKLPVTVVHIRQNLVELENVRHP